eukprot:CAMPEP_0197685346 /NCGR_PEP_ID=MMETSP1338-20131121/100809_1 /TAXON_ID=43686 ORGANISM="Pelagodinium beii, Strain RCC1491" /NCGR_SAMPLE_ID=MMETSP1338 /ASSEMBLY_ACC=CAM_ASM_000754 /LENGTH=108 /DNA_ID=CAMNT_0043267157 /DNA_START=150 /DNA_END=473 /DNA_ORIENTATION=+
MARFACQVRHAKPEGEKGDEPLAFLEEFRERLQKPIYVSWTPWTMAGVIIILWVSLSMGETCAHLVHKLTKSPRHLPLLSLQSGRQARQVQPSLHIPEDRLLEVEIDA